MDETYLCAYDQIGTITGFYPKSLLYLYKDIPLATVEIDSNTWQLILDNPGKYVVDINTFQVKSL
jgi:hypothetical protein